MTTEKIKGYFASNVTQRILFVAIICSTLFDMFGCTFSMKLMMDWPNTHSNEGYDYDNPYQFNGAAVFSSYRVYINLIVICSQLGLLYGVGRVSFISFNDELIVTWNDY